MPGLLVLIITCAGLVVGAEPASLECLVRGERIGACAYARDGASIFLSGRGQGEREIRRWRLPEGGGAPARPVAFRDIDLLTEGINPLPFADKLLFVRRGAADGGLWVRDLTTDEQTQVRRDPFLGLPPAVSGDGGLIMVSRWAGRSRRIGIVDPAEGTYRSIPGPDMSEPALDEAGARLLFIRDRHLWLRDLATEQERQLTAGERLFHWPAWDRQGRRAAVCVTLPDGAAAVGLLDVEGGEIAWLAGGLAHAACPAFSPDGAWLIFIARLRGDAQDGVFRVRLRQ